MLKWLQSSWKSFSAPAVLAPNCTGSGYRASLPLKADRLISHRMGQSRMHRGHMPLVGEVSLTLVVVPLVDLPLRYALLWVTLSLIVCFSPSHLYKRKPRREGYKPTHL